MELILDSCKFKEPRFASVSFLSSGGKPSQIIACRNSSQKGMMAGAHQDLITLHIYLTRFEKDDKFSRDFSFR